MLLVAPLVRHPYPETAPVIDNVISKIAERPNRPEGDGSPAGSQRRCMPEICLYRPVRPRVVPIGQYRLEGVGLAGLIVLVGYLIDSLRGS